LDRLRLQRADLAARCTLGAIYARRGDLSRAALHLAGCEDAALPDEIAAAVAKIHGELKKRLRASELSTIEVVSSPEGMTAETSALPGETFTTPATLWVQPGSYEIRATHEGKHHAIVVATSPYARTVAWIGDRPVPQRRDPGPTTPTVDFGDENAAESQQSGPPPDIKHPNIVPVRYRGAVALAEATGGGGPKLEDPELRVRSAPPPSYWLGLRVGAGVFDDGDAAARAGIEIAATTRIALAGPAFLAGRLDWSRRGGDAMAASGSPGSPAASIDALGVAAGAGLTLLDRRALSIAAIGQLRADLRLASARLGAEVARAGLGAAAGIDLVLPATPITAGVRFEQGLTALVEGARDRAVLVELGVELR
ncbi:MAG: hypothetical protein ACTHU0_33890, partial [Kofleriaceae bacterium]